MDTIFILADQTSRIRDISTLLSAPEAATRLHTANLNTWEPPADCVLASCDLVVLDHVEPHAARTEIIDALRGKAENLRILITGLPGQSGNDHADLIFSYIEYGAAGYVLARNEHAELLNASRQVAGGGVWIEPGLTAELVERTVALRDALATIKPHSFGAGQPAMLTRRQTEVLEFLAAGMTNREIANELFISVGTVKNHVHSILDVLQVSTRDQAAEYYQFIQPSTAAA